MPRTKFQGIVFSLMSALVMVYLMVLYNISLAKGGLKNITFVYTIIGMWPYYLIAVLSVIVIARPLAQRLTFRIFNRGDKPIFIMLAIQSFTVCFMVIIMACAATIIRNGFTTNFASQYLTAIYNNFTIAFFLQIFAAGPLVRLIFKKVVFRKQLDTNHEEKQGSVGDSDHEQNQDTVANS